MNTTAATIATANIVTATVNRTGAGTITTLRLFYAANSNSSTTITTGYTFYGANAGGSTSNYGIYLESISGGATNNYSIYTNDGLVRFGDNVDLASGKVYKINNTQIGIATGMGDTTITSPAAHQILAHDGTNWKNKTISKKSFILTANGGSFTLTTGATAAAVTESTTNKINWWAPTFAESSNQMYFWNIVLPDDYNSGLEFQIVWTTGSGSANVRWEISGRSFADDDAIDQASSAYTGVTDTILATGDVHYTAFTSFTPTNVGAGKWTFIKARRNSSDAADTSTATDVKLLAVIFRYLPTAY
jgi:hypothetical protein